MSCWNPVFLPISESLAGSGMSLGGFEDHVKLVGFLINLVFY